MYFTCTYKFEPYLLHHSLTCSNLYDRLNTRPFLSIIEKEWIAFQLVCALENCSKNAVSHGDIKIDNILLTSWNWAYLADFAPFKPTMLPAVWCCMALSQSIKMQ